MLNIEYQENIEEKYYKIIDSEFNKYADKNQIICNYIPFAFIAKEDDKFVGIITGNSYYKEIHISDLIVLEEYRKKHIGSKLVKAVEEYYKDKGFENMNFKLQNFIRNVDLKLNLLEKTRTIQNLINIF